MITIELNMRCGEGDGVEVRGDTALVVSSCDRAPTGWEWFDSSHGGLGDGDEGYGVTERIAMKTDEIKVGYEMTAINNSSVGFWEPCNATTLTAAKREATRRYKAGYLDDTIKVGYRDESGQLQVLAAASNRDNKWVDLS